MKIIVFFVHLLIGLFVVLSISVPLPGAIPASERAALIAFYNATNGDNWSDNTGWKGNKNESDGFSQMGSEENWFGISVSGNHVTSIYLGDNNLTGHIPAELGNLSNLDYLNLTSNQLSGSIPAELGNLSDLFSLYLYHNQLSGSIPSELGNLSNLYILSLDNNQLSGSIPPELGNLSNLWDLDLGSNQLSGSIPPELGNLSDLRLLLLGSNQLSGGIPPELGNLGNLLYLCLSHNQLTGSIPPVLGNLSNLESLSLYSNQLSGSIPLELGNLNNLDTLWLADNQLNGSIPPWLGSLSDLYSLNLSSNQLSGSIPPELGNLSNLEALSLSSNQLSGSIPPELGNLSDLYSLELSSNHLSGSIPPELGNLSNLGNLDLSFNQLTGNIPTSLTNLTNVWWLGIRYNCLYTDDPDLRVWLNSLDPGWESYQCGEEKDPPFGSFDTPIDGSTVASSIPVTGWALDDSGIDNVKIYRAQGKSLVYIGDAVLVEGARPDVAAAYPGYPNNTRAGWGYMMLTNFLPNSGNGTFVIHAIATDLAGKTTTLGTKTIHCDNANAVKPFGAIDTPTQGGTASGSSFTNWGWVLTPQPNSIPTDGSTINVYVDGVNIGHPTYNKYRSDIATLFPGYINSDGAAGYFNLDTTAYENGVHTIQWTATDDAGNTDGIGSRYFTIRNSGEAAGSRAHLDHIDRTQIPVDYYDPIEIIEGRKQDTTPQEIYPDDSGMINVEIRELERVEIHLEGTRGLAPLSDYTGCLAAGNQLKRLPIGSSLDSERGIFYWQPGPGFIGEYRFVFIGKAQDGEFEKKNIHLVIRPKF